MASHTICVSAKVVNNHNFVKNILSKKILKVSPKLNIAEIIDEALGDTEIDEETDFALTNGNFSAKLFTSENGSCDPFSIENDEPLTTALEFNPGIRYMNYTVNIDNNNETLKSSHSVHRRCNHCTLTDDLYDPCRVCFLCIFLREAGYLCPLWGIWCREGP